MTTLPVGTTMVRTESGRVRAALPGEKADYWLACDVDLNTVTAETYTTVRWDNSHGSPLEDTRAAARRIGESIMAGEESPVEVFTDLREALLCAPRESEAEIHIRNIVFFYDQVCSAKLMDAVLRLPPAVIVGKRLVSDTGDIWGTGTAEECPPPGAIGVATGAGGADGSGILIPAVVFLGREIGQRCQYRVFPARRNAVTTLARCPDLPRAEVEAWEAARADDATANWPYADWLMEHGCDERARQVLAGEEVIWYEVVRPCSFFPA